jgi:hypothetical protein
MRLLYYVFLLCVASCSHIDVAQYKQQQPKLDLQQYLNGNIKGCGIVEDRSGNITKRFDFSGKANWDRQGGHFYEKITYSDGKIESRVWTFTKLSESSYEATTADVIGKATIKVAGNAMNWQYTMNIKVNNSSYAINFDDWMFLMNDGRIINRNYFHKFGFKVGELTLFMQKESQ